MRFGFGLGLAQHRHPPSSSTLPVPTLADFYGIGPGQIPLDLRLDNPAAMVLNVSAVELVENDGGAGPMFAAKKSQVYPAPVWTGKYVDFSAANDNLLVFQSPLDLNGTHAFFLLRMFSFSNVRIIAGDGGGANSRGLDIQGTVTLKRARIMGPAQLTLALSDDFPVTAGTWVLLETRMSPERIQMWADGALICDVVRPDGNVGYPVTMFGWARNSSAEWDSGIGRAVSVVVDAPATGPLEPAVLVARQTLAAQYGITLA